MLRGFYNVASALEMATRNHEIVSRNIVHATTPGYRREGLLFEVSTSSTGEDLPNPAASSRNPVSYSHFETGPMEQTNNPLDLALSGQAFFVVDGPNGPVYTRNGSFEVGPNGELRTRGGGLPVRGQSGAITLPPNATNPVIGYDGTIRANGTDVGRLQFANFARPASLRRVGTTLFEGDAPETPPTGSVRVEQGYREGSNVQPAQEMVAMMQGMRFYEAAQKAMQVMSEAIGQNTRSQSA